MRTTITALAFAALAAAPALAQTAWTAAPTVAEMTAAYPQKARAAGVGGGVELICTARRDGGLDDCAVLGEAPRGYGFGLAARRLAGKLTAAGVVPGSEIRTSITFPAELAGGGPLTVKTPRWTAMPNVDQLQAVVPKSEGGPNDIRVTLVCEVVAAGMLTGCGVDREIPAGQGFGEAILSLSDRFRVDLMSAEGMPTVGAKVRVPVRFDLKPVDQAAR